MDMSGTTAVVTGAASGLGAAVARRLVQHGAHVLGLDVPHSIDRAGNGVPAGVQLVAADVTSETEVVTALDLVDAIHPIRIAVNCAGVGWAGRIVSKHGPHDLEIFRTVMTVNLLGTFNVMRLAADRMRVLGPVDASGQRGLIVNTASVAAFEGQVGQAAYAASKGGIHAMTITAARDLAQYGIRVNTIAPGTVDTPMVAAMDAGYRAALASSVPFPARLGRPDEFAQLVQMLVEHDYINGETTRMDGAVRMAPR
ncbi:3-hydroxyacyl-CoA dehydrogenase [Rhodococcus sp. WWJCD1]|uniref:SDR family NAD(P)-dependent oxidoreductase n=1 Tax=Rhodococcus sp. WWJCD1 TaxID=2022519 RepID=UPI000B9A66B4|nr:SDR family NAD(P)-dependent oxidoreductase [Rhodococcus sp. WWJCD1]OZC41553.1 3-hydroxyacyl-CoA dehydrogenase [Rhodococcus sp. WWJCD1]